MRITHQAKEETRRRILDAAAELFRSRGFDATTTRDIAREAAIAAGTLFNYFESKEAIVARLAQAALAWLALPSRKREPAVSSRCRWSRFCSQG